MSTIHDRIEEIIAAALSGGLDAKETDSFLEHLGSCPECMARFEEAKAVSNQALDAFATEKPDKGFEDRLASAFRAREHATAAPARISWFASSRTRMAAAAVVLLALSGAVFAVFLQGLTTGDKRDFSPAMTKSGKSDRYGYEKASGAGLPASAPAGRHGLVEEALERDILENKKEILGKELRSEEMRARVGVLVVDGVVQTIVPGDDGPNREGYDHIEDNPFIQTASESMSTFSIDVDTASYANVRRMLRQGMLPPKGAVRIEEMVNYFRYDYPSTVGSEAFTVFSAVAQCPWNLKNRILRIGIKAREVQQERRPPSNLVFLLDVSGSMESENKLPLVKQAMRMLVNQLTALDRVTIVVYAGAEGLALAPTSGDNKTAILEAMDNLSAGGSTNGGAGIRLAYAQAQANFIQGGINRVILATDGDFNVGTTSRSDLVDLITDKAKSGVFLTVLGFGMGNYQDGQLESLADKGNGNYAYIDDQKEANKVLVEQMSGTLITVAKDVKIQVEFNPVKVKSWRLIGYENRVMRNQDFRDDAKDAGEIGAGHTVTALYEVEPSDGEAAADPEPRKYQDPARPSAQAYSGELLTVRLRHKEPESSVATEQEFAVMDSAIPFDQATADLRFAASVAAFGMVLRGSKHKGGANIAMVRELANDALGYDPGGYRAEFLTLVDLAGKLGAGGGK